MYIRVLRGDRPDRPSHEDGVEMSDALWSLVTQCWSLEPAARPSADMVVHAMLRILSQYRPSTPIVISATTSVESDIGQLDSPTSLSIPLALRVHGLQRLDTVPVTGSETSDVFLGRYEGKKVALKRFRVFMHTEHERRLHRVSSSTYRSALTEHRTLDILPRSPEVERSAT